MNVPEGERKIGSIVITADKGLAGAYNHNIVKLEEEILARPGIHKLFIVGELGRHYFAKRDVQIDTNFQYTVQNPTMHRARDIAAVLLDQFDETLADSGDDPHPVLVATRRLAKQLAAQRSRRRQNPDHAAT